MNNSIEKRSLRIRDTSCIAGRFESEDVEDPFLLFRIVLEIEIGVEQLLGSAIQSKRITKLNEHCH